MTSNNLTSGLSLESYAKRAEKARKIAQSIALVETGRGKEVVDFPKLVNTFFDLVKDVEEDAKTIEKNPHIDPAVHTAHLAHKAALQALLPRINATAPKSDKWKWAAWIGGGIICVTLAVLAVRYFYSQSTVSQGPPLPPKLPPEKLKDTIKGAEKVIEDLSPDQIWPPENFPPSYRGGMSGFDTKWFEGLPDVIKTEAAFIGKHLGSLESLKEMNEKELRLATKEMPNTFRILDFYRTGKAPLPSDLQELVNDYKIQQLSCMSLNAAPSSLDATLQGRLKRIETKLKRLNPSSIGSGWTPDEQLTIDWKQALRTLSIASFSAEHGCHSKIAEAEKTVTDFEKKIVKSAKTAKPASALSSFIESDRQAIDDSLFQQILGEYWGKKSGLEGYSSVKMLRHILAIIEQHVDASEKNSICPDRKGFDTCREIFWEEQIDLNVYRSMRDQFRLALELSDIKSSKEFLTGIKKAMDGLKEEESFFFMGGWVNKHYSGGHAVAYEIARQMNGRFAFRIFNRGAGLEYHGKALEKNSVRSISFYEVVDIPAENIANFPFISALREMDSPPPNGEDWDSPDLYASLLPLLGGKATSGSYPLSHAMERLNVGHCTYLSLTALLHRNMGGASESRFILDLQFKTLWDYYSAIKNNLREDSSRRQLLSKGCKSLAKRIQKSFENNLLTLPESKYFQTRLGEVADAVEAAEKSPIVSPLSIGVESCAMAVPSGLPAVETVDFSVNGPNRKAFVNFDVSTFKPDPATFLRDCKNWLYLFKDVPKGQDLIAKEAIKDWVRMLPVDWIEQPHIWSKISKSDAENILGELSGIAKAFLKTYNEASAGEADRKGYLEPTDFFTVIKLLTVGVSLGKQANMDLAALYQYDMDLLLETSGRTAFFDPEMEDQIRSLKTYWDSKDPPEERQKRDNLSFFGVEATPFGAGITSRKIDLEKSTSCSPTFQWPFLDWAEKYVAQPDVDQRLREENPELAKQNTAFKAVAALYDLWADYSAANELKDLITEVKAKPKKVLPKAFYALRDLSLSVNAMIHPTSWSTELEPVARLDFNSDCKNHQFSTRESNNDVKSDFSDAIYQVPKAKREELNGNAPGTAPTDSNHFLERGQDALDAPYHLIFGKKRWIFPNDAEGKSMERLRVGPHLRTHFPTAQFEGVIDREEIQDLLSLSSVKQLQVVETLGYFKTRIPHLDKKEFQTLFMSLMMEPPLLIQQLINGDDLFASELSHFVKNGYEFYEKMNNRQASAYFLDLSRHFSSSVNYVAKKRGKLFKDVQFPDAPSELKRHLAKKGLDLKSRTAHWLDIAAAASPHDFKREEAFNLLTANAFSHFFPIDAEDPLYSRSEEIISRSRLARFQGKLRKIMLDQENRKFILNSVLKEVLQISQGVSWLRSPDFPYYSTADGAYSIDVSSGKIFQRNQSIVILPPAFRNIKRLQPFIDDPKTLMVRQKAPDRYEWNAPDGSGVRVSQGVVLIKIQREIEKNIWAEHVDAVPDKFPAPTGLLHNRDLWVEAGSGAQKFWVSDPSTGKALCRIEESGIVSLDKQWKVAIPEKTSLFHSLDEEGFVLVWTDQEYETAEIELPRYRLRLPVKEGKILFPAFPEFFLSSVQPSPIASLYPRSIALENKAGKKKVVMLNPDYPDRFFAFDADNLVLQPRQREDRLYLALMQLQSEEFDAARASLEKFKSQLKVFSPQEKVLLEAIAHLKKFAPPALGVRMEALSLLYRNKLDFAGANPSVDAKAINELLWSYEQFISEIPPRFRMAETQEKWLLRFLKGEEPLLHHRAAALEKGSVRYPDEKGNTLAPDWNPIENLWSRYWTIKVAKLGGKNTRTSNLSFLRRDGLTDSFPHFYNLARKGGLDAYREWFFDLMGEQPAATLDAAQLKGEIQRALSMIALSRTEAQQRLVAVILLAVLDDPSRFKKTDALIPQLHTSSWQNNYLWDEVTKFLLASARDTLDRLKNLELPGAELETAKEMPFEPAKAASIDAVCKKAAYAALSNQPLPLPRIVSVESAPAAVPTELADQLEGASLSDSVAKRQFSDLSKRLRKFTIENQPLLKLENIIELRETKKSLMNSSKETRERLERMEQELCAFANKEPSDEIEKLTRNFKQISGHEKPLTARDLSLAFLQSDPNAIKKINPALTCEESRQVVEKLQEFLILSVRHSQQKRLIDAMGRYETASEKEQSGILEEMKLIAEAKRSYSIEEHPEYLVFEAAMGIMLWPQQIEKLQELRQKYGTVLELIMGSGKTKVLTALLALRRADGKAFSMYVEPEANLPDVFADLDERLGKAFAQAIEVFHFDRNTSLEELDLQRILDRMHSVIADRKAALITSSSLQSFVLRFIGTEAQDGFEKEKKLFREIFTLMQESGALTLDEMDSLLDVLKAHHFTQGKPTKMQEDLLDAVVHVYRVIAKNAHGLKWNFLEQSRGEPLTEANYEKLKSSLADELLQGGADLDPEVDQFLSSLGADQKKLAKDYILQKKTGEVSRFVEASAQKVKNALSVWKEEVSRLLLLTGKKHLAEHYGPNPKDPSGMAIPYYGSNNALIGSQHGTDLEILNYTIQMYLRKGVGIKTIEAEIKRLREIANKEIAEKRITLEETQSYASFRRLSGGREDWELFLLSESELETILGRVNGDAELKLEMIRRHILPMIPIYLRQLHTNPHILSTLFKRPDGFSGTVWNFDTFPRSYDRKIPSDTEERTLHLLWNKCPVSTLQSMTSSLKDQISALYATHRGSFADLGGIFRGVDSETVARAIIDLPIWDTSRLREIDREGEIKGIAYYDNNDQKRIWIRGEHRSIPFEQSEFNKNEIIAYWAQKYTTGSDIPLAPDMQAVVSVGQHTMMRDFLQAVWRLRELHRGQRASVVLLPEDIQVMRETLKIAGYAMQDPPTLTDVLFYVKYNEALRQGDDNLRALRFKIRSVLIDRLWDILLDPKKSHINCHKAIDQLFFKEKSENAYDHYGQLEESAKTKDVVDEEIGRLKKSAAFTLFPPHEQEQILSAWKQIVSEELPKLPLSASRASSFETLVSVQSEIQVQAETKQEQKIFQDVQFDANTPETHVFLWKGDNLFKKSYFVASSSRQTPDPDKFPAGALALPDFESIQKTAHPLDHLNVDGANLLPARPVSLFGQHTDPGLLESWNTVPNEKTQVALVIQDPRNNSVRLMRLNQWDALMFQRLLEKDQENPVIGERDHRLALYHLETGIFAQGADRIDPGALERDEGFRRMLVQSKFFNGETYYSKDEIGLLEKWMRSEGVSALKDLFIHTILRNKPKSAGAYSKSRLAALFERLFD